MSERRIAAVLGTVLALTVTPATAQDVPGRPFFAPGAPLALDELPRGALRDGLRRLPPQARARALERLGALGFPAADVARMRVDAGGGIFYVDPPIARADPPAGPEGTLPAGVGAAEVFSLHSNPGAANVVFVDVDGHVIDGTAWNGGGGPLYARPFDTDGDESAFSPEELDRIAEIWHRVAEDFAAFDVDVTTEDPGFFGPRTAHLLVTSSTDAYGAPMPASGSGGVAYVGVFGGSSYGYHSPALVYADNLARFAPYIAEAASHEVGHNLGLSHDGTSTSPYYAGHGSGATSWGPIMGTGYDDDVSQWSRGEYADANNPQDDIAIIASRTGTRGDDHADDPAAATRLRVEADGAVLATTPESDPFGTDTANKGIVGERGDVDLFGFSAGAGPVRLDVTPSWAAWPRERHGRGTNLDVEATLYDAFGNAIARSDPEDETSATIETTLVAGDYYLGVRGVGNASSPYPDYGSQGHYFVTGRVTPGDAEPPPEPEPDTTPPTPDPMGFAVAPAALDGTRVTMTARVASDESGSAVEYLFTSPTAGDSGWVADPVWIATGLEPGTTHAWQVAARDAAGNRTAPSAPAGATTEPAPPPEPEPPTAPAALVAGDNGDGTATLAWVDGANESALVVVRERWHAKRRRWNPDGEVASLPADATGYTDASGTGRFRYLVRATNAVGAAESGRAEVTVTADDGGGCRGGPKKCGGA